jgi:hypothetical protein
MGRYSEMAVGKSSKGQLERRGNRVSKGHNKSCKNDGTTLCGEYMSSATEHEFSRSSAAVNPSSTKIAMLSVMHHSFNLQHCL